MLRGEVVLVHLRMCCAGMGLVDRVPRWLSSLLLCSLLVGCVPLSPRTFPSSGKPHKGPGQDPSWLSPTLIPPRTVLVRCRESAVEIAVKADLFQTGALIDGAYLRLGWNPLVKGAQPAAKCGAVASGEGEYTIFAELTDCGTELVFTNEWLVYKNTILYSPAPLPDGIIRLDEIMIPFECHYKRQYSVDSNVLVPTWVPFAATQSAEEAFYFTLRLLTADWHSERATNVYFLGDVINLEASVFQGNHVPLRVFLDTCMATLVPDVNSDPRYAFIENGCFTDARATGSSSRFLPRTQDNNLHLELEAFRIYQDSRNSIYITCLVTAEPVPLSGQSTSQACSYVDGRWTSVDGSDEACGSCEGPYGLSSGKGTTEAGVWKRGTEADTTFRKNVTIGPLIVHEPEQADAPEVLVAEHSGTSVDTPTTVAGAGSAVDASAVPTEAGTMVDTPKALPVEQGNELEDPVVLEFGQVEASNTSPLPLTGQSANSMDATPALSIEAGTIVESVTVSEMVEISGSSRLVTKQEVNLDDKTEEADTPVSSVELETLAVE